MAEAESTVGFALMSSGIFDPEGDTVVGDDQRIQIDGKINQSHSEPD
jgi:hypothetical protein